MALPVLRFIRKEITKQVSYELHALRAIKIFFKDFRVYLKTGNMTNSEGFFACCAPFFRGNTLCIARENGAQQAEKTRCLGMLTVFR